MTLWIGFMKTWLSGRTDAAGVWQDPDGFQFGFTANARALDSQDSLASLNLAKAL